MASFVFKLASCAMLLALVTTEARAACPAFCYCTKRVATRICALPTFSGKCRVEKCSKASCGTTGYRCSEAPTTPPLPSPVPLSKPLSFISPARKLVIQNKINANGGCKANICFAIDGSSSIRSQSFTNEKDFVTEVVKIIIDFELRVAATQYNQRNHPITAMTTDVNAMINAVTATSQKGGSTSIAAGINYCGDQFRPFPGQPNKVVVLGDGFNNAGGSENAAARNIWNAGGVVSVVYAGSRLNDAALLALTGNNPDLKFTVKNFNDRFALIEKIEELSIAICAA